MSFDLEDVLTSWKVAYGQVRVSKAHGTEYYAIPKEERQELIRHLVQTLKNKGKDQFYFKQNDTKNAIASACFPPVGFKKEARQKGYEVVWRELREVVAEFWPDPDMAMATENVRSTRVEQKPTETYNPSIHESPFKDLDRSKFKDAPETIASVDDEASKLLGFDNE